MSAAHHNLYHRFIYLLRQKNMTRKKLLLAVSGGMDSITLLSLMMEARKILKLDLKVAHVHHGSCDLSSRNQAQIFVHSLCHGLGLPFLSNLSFSKNKPLSEEELRKFRYHLFRKWMKQTKSDYIVLAHTANDVLETRLIRLIRGTGAQGFLSMGFCRENLLRPLIFFTRDEIVSYVQSQKLSWIQDPTNQKTNFLRNWIRNVWLKQLEKKRKGGVQNLSHSLERILEELHEKSEDLGAIQTFQGLCKKKFLKLSDFDQKKVLAKYMRRHQLKNYGQNHMSELIKRIKRPDKNQKVKVAGKVWILSQDFIRIQ